MIFAKKVLNTDLILACTRACEKIQVEIQKYIQTGFKFGSSSIETDPYNMALCLEQSLNVLSLSIVLEKMEISFFDDLYGSSNSKIWYFPKEKQSLLVRTAISGDSATALNLVDEFFQKCPRESESSLSYIRMQVLELLVNAIKQLEIINDYQEESKIMRKAIDQVWTYDTVDEIEKFLKRVFSTFAKNRIRHYQSRVQNTVELLIDYIQYHYKEDLSLDLLSEQFHLSNSYISRLISNYTGKSFGENLLKIRMKKAKQFLEKNQLKISEIAENLGYHDTSYFIQVFKKYFGITPSEYRKQYK